jgi:hypothetical protein
MNDLGNDWEIKNNKNQNKRNISTSSSTSLKSPTLPKNKKSKKPLFITINRFEDLFQNDNEVFAATPKGTISNEVIPDELIKPPPPIFVRSVLEFKDLCNEKSKLIGKDKFFCKSSTIKNPNCYSRGVILTTRHMVVLPSSLNLSRLSHHSPI